MADPDDLLARYLRRNPEAGAAFAVSPEYHHSISQARQLLRLAEDAMEAEGVPDTTRERVLRAVIYGTPDPDAALDAHAQRQLECRRLMNTPPGPGWPVLGQLDDRLAGPTR